MSANIKSTYQPSNDKRRRFNPGDIFQAVVIAAIIATLTLPLAALVFALVRFTLPVLYGLPLLHNFLRPFTAHFLRGPWTLSLPFRHLPLLIRAWFLAFTTLANWEFANAIFDTLIYYVCTRPYLNCLNLLPDIFPADFDSRIITRTPCNLDLRHNFLRRGVSLSRVHRA